MFVVSHEPNSETECTWTVSFKGLMGNRSIVGEGKRKEMKRKEKKASINLKGCVTSHLMNAKYDHIRTSQIGPVSFLFHFVYFCNPNNVLIFVVPCIMLNSEINPTRCNNCVYSSQWLYSTCFG